MPPLTICICTLDRAADLQRNFDALLRNESIETVEILVVNNGPGETTSSVVDTYKSRLPVRYIKHNKPTVGEVLNRAWQEASAEWLVYIDDDSIVYPTWLPAILKAISNLGPEYFGMAGNVDMGTPPLPLPDWCSPGLAASAYSNVNFGEEDKTLKFPEAPLGNNLAIRKSFLARHGGFSSELRTYWESHIFWQGYWEGGSCLFNSGMTASHIPSQARLNKEWPLNKIRNSGNDCQRLLTIFRHHSQCPSRYDVLFKLPLVTLKLAIGYLSGNEKRIMNFRALQNFELGRFEQQFLSKKAVEYSTFNKKPQA